MKNSFCLKFLSLCLILQKILGMEVDDGLIIISRKPTEIIHVDLRFTMDYTEKKELKKLTENLKNKCLNQYQVDRSFSNAASLNWRCTMDFLLTPQEGQLFPSSCSINKVLSTAVIANNQPLVKFLINRTAEQVQLDQWIMNEALWNAAILGQEAMVELLLNRPEGQLRPDRNGIDHAYDKAVKCGFINISDIFLPYKRALK